MRLEETGFFRQLKECAGKSEIRLNESMDKHTTFRVGGEADIFINVADASDASAIIKCLSITGNDYYILGKGSNILVGDKGYRGTILCLNEMNEISVEGDTIKAGAGVSLAKLASVAKNEALTGLEFASGIPGSLGGAVFMNAGAYGGEMAQIVVSVEVMDESGHIFSMSNEDMQFGYRDSVLKHQKLICLGATMRLEKGDETKIADRMKELASARKEKQPLEYPSAGSTFKRPEGYFAGKLIMDAGLSGYTIGGAQVSRKHCGFVINIGDATAADIKDLIDEVTEKVRVRFNVTLEPEVCFLGDF